MTKSFIVLFLVCCQAIVLAKNPIIPNKGANDPHIRIIDGKAYLSASHDKSADNKKFVMEDWWLWSSDDLVNWKLEYTLNPEETYINKPFEGCWATDIVKRNGKWYWYFSERNHQAGVMVAASPQGPWKDLLGKPLLSEDLTPTHEYDMGIFEDTNGEYYIVFGVWDFYIARLNEDMISLAEKPRKITINNPYGPYNQDGNNKEKPTDDKPFLHYYNGNYYLSWGCFYAMANNPYGPFDYKGSIIEQESFAPGYDAPTWPNGFKQGRHGSFFQWHKQWYFTYCDISQTGNRYFRDSFISYVHYKENGEMALIRVDGIGVGEYDADKGIIEAENYYQASGIVKKENKNGGFCIAEINNNDYLIFNNIKGLEGKTKIVFNALAIKNVEIEIREGSPSGKKIATYSIAKSTEQHSSQYKFDFPELSGKQSLCFVFKGKGKDLLELDSYSFHPNYAQLKDDYRWTLLETSGEVKGRHENAFVEFKDKFYLIGGRGINPVNVFDPQTNSWETKNNTPLEIHHFQAVVYGNAIYLTGAMTGKYPKETPLENIWIYYPEEDKWERGPEIPKARRRGGAGTVIYKDKLYMVGGIEYGHTSGTNNYFDSYDLKTGQWEILTKAPHVRDHFQAIVVNDKLYCVGGRNTSVHHPNRFGAFFEATIPFIDVYDFNEGKWITLKEELPYPSAAGGIVELGNKLIYMGGEGKFKHAYYKTQCLDLETGKWKQLSPMVIGRHGSSAILHNNKIYVAAGSQKQGGGNMNSIEVFSPEHNWKQIFNGKNLDGWEVKCVEQDKDKNYWKVENGTILCDSRRKKDHQYIWLQSVDEFADFEIRLQFQATLENKGNAGVQVRSRYDENAKVDGEFVGWLDGPQVDIEPNNPWRTGLIYDETRETRRWISPSLPNSQISKEKYAPKKVIYYWNDEEPGWNDLRIVCKGMQITTYVNNILVSDYDGTGVLDDEAHKRYNVSEKGHIALQLHKFSDNYIRYKNIEIRELK
jgi:N-acetylneuraminic acid mutarotase